MQLLKLPLSPSVILATGKFFISLAIADLKLSLSAADCADFWIFGGSFTKSAWDLLMTALLS